MVAELRKIVVRGLEYFKMSADQGNSFGKSNYGLCLENGYIVEQDVVRAAEYYKLSAEQGNTFGQWEYGGCLEIGVGV
jgi:TPR repeat protein